MQKLLDILNSPQGRRFLEENSVFTDRSDFLKQLTQPVKTDLSNILETHNQKIVCSYQQLALDYHRSILRKISEFASLEQHDICNLFIWMDTDQAGSNKLTRRFSWTEGEITYKISVAHANVVKNTEPRFVIIKKESLNEILDHFDDITIHHSSQNKDLFLKKINGLKDIFIEKDERILSELTFDLTKFLLAECQYPKINHVVLSDLLKKKPFLKNELNTVLNSIVPLIKKINQVTQTLSEQNIDVLLPLFPTTYLPFHYSCEACSSRINLSHTIDQQDHFATGTCSCGQDYHFFLGHTGNLSIDDVQSFKPERLSPSVWLPLFLNDYVSGFIGGVSSGLYTIPFNQAMSEVLGKKPAPLLIPRNLDEAVSCERTLINDYFEGICHDKKC